MNLKSVELNNFRLFKGNQILDLKENDLNVVVGANASGKSSIVEAIRWCLYGISGSSILNFKTAEENDTKTISVKCHFEDESDEFIINRSMVFNEDNQPIGGDDFVIMINNEIIANPYYFIEEKFPRHLYDMANNSLDKNIGLLPEIISKRSGIEDLYKIRNHLRLIEKNYINNLSKLNPNVSESIESVEEKLFDVEDRIRNAEVAIHKTQEKLKQYDKTIYELPDMRELINMRDMLIEKSNTLSREINDCEEELELILIKELPSYIVFSKGIDSFDIKKIENSLFENDSQNNDLIKDYSTLKNSLLHLEGIDKIKELSKKLNFLRGDHAEIDLQLNEVESKLELSIPIEDTYREIKSLEKNLQDLNHERVYLMNFKSTLKNDLKKLSVERMNNLVVDDFDSKIEFIHEVIDSINVLVNGIEKESLSKLTNSINEHFLANSIVKYDEILIDEKFNISLSELGFKIMPNDLSGAELELLNLSLILAIHEYCENKFLLILDSPLMRLDLKGRESVINMLKNDESQKLLLLNDSEAVNISKDYELQVNDSMEVVINGQ